MAKNSATVREQEPNPLELTRTNTIINALKRRALAILNDESLDAQSRAVLRYSLETNDPWLAELVRRAEAGKTIDDSIDFSRTPETNNAGPSQEKLEALVEMICRAGDKPAAALFVLMGTIEHSTQPQTLANMTKHRAFTYCGELNVYGIVDAQFAVVESELLSETSLTS